VRSRHAARWRRVGSGSLLLLPLAITAWLAGVDDGLFLLWVAIGLPLAGAGWAAVQRGFSGNVVLGSLVAVFLIADVVAMLASREACCYSIVFATLHGATAVLSGRLAERVAAGRRARLYGSVRRGLATFRELRRAPRSAYR
jgi:hypothetical protein